MKMLRWKEHVPYVLVAFFGLIISLALGWSSYSARINQNFYDLYFHQRGAKHPANDVVVVAIDDATLARYGLLPLNRSLLAQAINAIQNAKPRLLAIDLLLTDLSTPDSDHDLEAALAEAHPVLSAALEAQSGEHWLLPLPPFANVASAIGHVHAEPDSDGVSRQVLLEKQADRKRYWALALECFRIVMGAPQTPITETSDALGVPRGAGGNPVNVPAKNATHRAMLINYAGPEGTFERVSLARLLDTPSQSVRLRNKIVFLGVTAQGTGDRLFTPFSSGVGMAGVEIHANILHTLLTGSYLQPVGDLSVVLAVVAITLATVLALAWFRGPVLILPLAGIALISLVAPYWLFLHGQVWPAFSLLIPFGVTTLLCGAYQLILSRREFAQSETRRRRSQQQFEMATHEIRTPLTAIQASSELLTRYPLDDAKRKQMLDLIFEESQRLGKLVERFLNVERLSAGEIELKRAPVNLMAVLRGTIERLRSQAERKRIELVLDHASSDDAALDLAVEGDAELLEFAISNLVTNAVKYSPAGTSVRLALELRGKEALIHVTDSGAGMTPEESRRIFDRFFRTDSAKNSDVPGFGLGLAIAREIARHHGGNLELESRPGSGSRFTISLPVATSAGQRKQVAL